jgi:hypothetical protein
MKSVSIKVWVETRKLLRLISAMTDESIQEVVQRLAQAEWDRVNKQK